MFSSGGTLASGSADGTVRLWQESDQETQTFTVAEDDTGDPVSPPPSTTPPPTTSGLNLTITPSPSGTMLETGDRINLTIRITHSGVAWPEKSVRLYTSGSVTPTLTGDPHQDGGIKGTTDNNGEVQITLELDLEQTGSFKFVAETSGILPSDPKVTNELSFTVAEGSGADAGSINIITPSPSTFTTVDPNPTIKVEPNQGTSNGRISLAFEVKTPAGNPLAGAPVFLSTVSSSIISTFTNDRPRTDSNGIARTTLQLKRSSATGSITVKAVVKEGVEAALSITVKRTPSSLSVSGVPSSLTSGNTRKITATVKSGTGTRMSGIRVEFVDNNDSEISFDHKSRTTDRDGKAWTTLRTGSEGPADYVVRAGSLSKTFNIRVNPWQRPFTERYERVFSRYYWWCGSLDWYNWTRYAHFPSRVVKSTVTVRRRIGNNDNVTFGGWTWHDSNTIKLWGQIKEHCAETNTIRMYINGEYKGTASSRPVAGAPSVQPQLQPETHLLSEVWQELSQVPSETALLRNYPNPFNPETWIPYHLAEPAEATLTLYDIKGTPVRRLDLGHQMAGYYANRNRAAYWDGKNERGEWVGSGVYFYQLTAGDFSAMRKMVILK